MTVLLEGLAIFLKCYVNGVFLSYEQMTNYEGRLFFLCAVYFQNFRQICFYLLKILTSLPQKMPEIYILKKIRFVVYWHFIRFNESPFKALS